ncbi:hypothetical protein HYV74_03240 [Candidatus Uhrbacteria bacterium]|nr:hypothetical protein [Candidatus Uhrbacteria bacterium]
MRNLIITLAGCLGACATTQQPQVQQRRQGQGPAGIDARAEKLFDDLLREEDRAECRDRTGNSRCEPPTAPAPTPAPGR